MKKRTILAGLLTLCLPTLVLTLAFADGEREEEHEGVRSAPAPAGTPAGPGRARYQAECGSCHMAYPAGLLAPADWKRILDRLDNHFGDNAELSPAVRKEVSTYLLGAAAPRAGRAAPSPAPAASDAPLPRITEQRWFRREHGEIPTRMVLRNDQVRSFSNCIACHQGVERRGFSEHAVSIPGYGR